MASATITSKGQITIPSEVRKALGLRAGSRVAFVPTDTGSYELVAETRSVTALKGVIASRPETVSLAEMEEAIGDGAMSSVDQ